MGKEELRKATILEMKGMLEIHKLLKEVGVPEDRIDDTVNKIREIQDKHNPYITIE